MVTGSDLAQSQQAIDLAKRYPGRCYATVGVHPCAANSFEEEDEGGRGGGGGEALLEKLEAVAREGVRGGWVVAFGEIGVDFDRLGLAGREVQERWFGRQVEVAVKVCFLCILVFFLFFCTEMGCLFVMRFVEEAGGV